MEEFDAVAPFVILRVASQPLARHASRMIPRLAKQVRWFAPKRRWMQFSLGTMLVLLTALCIWLAVVVNRARCEREGLAAAERLRAQVRFDYQIEYRKRPKNDVLYLRREPPGPRWLREIIGDEYFREAHSVGFNGSHGSRVTDADLEQIVKLKRLTKLQLHVAGTSELSNGGLQHLAALHDLRVLTFEGVRLDPRGLDCLRKLPQLEYLNLRNTPVDDEALVYVGELKELYTLVLDGTRVTDKGLVRLARLTNLNEWLGLADTDITDAGLAHLMGLTKLEHLNLSRTKVTAAGVAKLQQSLPNVEISFGP